MNSQEAGSALPLGLSKPAIFIISALGLALLLALWNRDRPNEMNTANSPNESSEVPNPDSIPLMHHAKPITIDEGVPALSPEQQKRQIESQFAAYETLYRNDTVDAKWSMEAEKIAVEAASEPALTELGIPTAYSARCAAHLCKMIMQFDSRAVADDWAQFYPVGLGGTLSSVQSTIDIDADGKSTLIIFGTRNGFQKMLYPPQSKMMRR